jgi:hypothetical protein
MGLFSFFNQKGNPNLSPPNTTLPEIPENVFSENEKQETNSSTDNAGSPKSQNGINLLFQFLERNHESKGYDDALVNPDHTHLNENVKALKNDLERTLRKVKTFYEDFIKEIDFHIDSRSRTGMIDTVGELTVKKQIAETHIQQVLEIEKEAKNDTGVGQGIILSYTRGFRNGLAAISHHSILRKNF